MPKRVLITGGSIAGNTLAWWMEKAGYDVVVVEREPEFRDGGRASIFAARPVPSSSAWA